jgi:hypothetical protein
VTAGQLAASAVVDSCFHKGVTSTGCQPVAARAELRMHVELLSAEVDGAQHFSEVCLAADAVAAQLTLGSAYVGLWMCITRCLSA